MKFNQKILYQLISERDKHIKKALIQWMEAFFIPKPSFISQAFSKS